MGWQVVPQNFGLSMAIQGNPTWVSSTKREKTEIHHEPLAIGGYLPLETVYNFDPIMEGLKYFYPKKLEI